MKKSILILAITLFSFSVIADECEDNFNKGVYQNAKGNRFVQTASRRFESAKEESSSSNPDNEVVCESLQEARMAAWLGGKQFIKAVQSFRKAYMSCYDENEESAKRNRRLNEKNLESQREFIGDMCDVLSSQCDVPCPDFFNI
ncbi:hypothetical protein A9Q84_13610 [Halobacteriovorax marinus]|uniref:Secreted protein n=1 Tax=Halobacteriovorax marinus TaxID=97084 RepID=A0A1Y5F8U5_9BACT|nr:hypothetical protein A9Q84_13610 [Halobacteriovorax marinus]